MLGPKVDRELSGLAITNRLSHRFMHLYGGYWATLMTMPEHKSSTLLKLFSATWSQAQALHSLKIALAPYTASWCDRIVHSFTRADRSDEMKALVEVDAGQDPGTAMLTFPKMCRATSEGRKGTAQYLQQPYKADGRRMLSMLRASSTSTHAVVQCPLCWTTIVRTPSRGRWALAHHVLGQCYRGDAEVMEERETWSQQWKSAIPGIEGLPELVSIPKVLGYPQGLVDVSVGRGP